LEHLEKKGKIQSKPEAVGCGEKKKENNNEVKILCELVKDMVNSSYEFNNNNDVSIQDPEQLIDEENRNEAEVDREDEVRLENWKNIRTTSSEKAENCLQEADNQEIEL